LERIVALLLPLILGIFGMTLLLKTKDILRELSREFGSSSRLKYDEQKEMFYCEEGMYTDSPLFELILFKSAGALFLGGALFFAFVILFAFRGC